MPYKDPEKRRTFHREYKRRRRAELAHPLTKFRVYICPQIPFLRVGPGISFENGFFVTDCPESQNMVEANREFGRHIFPLALDLTRTSTEDDSEMSKYIEQI